MKTLRLLTFAFLLLFITNTTKAQWVSIPDSNFGKWLNTNGFSQCLQGNSVSGWQMDTTCNAVVTAQSAYCRYKEIKDLTGIQYFDNLVYLDCITNDLTWLPPLPANLKGLYCSGQRYNGGPGISFLPTLPAGLLELYCSGNSLTELPALPSTLTHLDIGGNQLDTLPALPLGLKLLNFASNHLAYFPVLPAGLLSLECGGNVVDTLPASLPTQLNYLSCVSYIIDTIPALPPTLRYFDCSYNKLSVLPVLPAGLTFLGCGGIGFDTLPTLPPALEQLFCSDNNLTVLPALPDSLYELYAARNPLTTLPSLPKRLNHFSVEDCMLTSLPELPDSLETMDLYGNHSLMCLPELKIVKNINLDSTGITCLPNYPLQNITCIPALNSFQLCDVFNPNACAVYWNITGRTYSDANNNCVADGSEINFQNVNVQLWHNGSLQQQAFNHHNGGYSFNTTAYSTYQLTVDTSNIPFRVLCPATGSLTSVISAADSMDYSMDFALACKPGYDLEARSIASSNVFRPANNTYVEVAAGDATNFYNAHCAAGTSGSITLAFTGPVTFTAPANGALTPTLSGNTLTWTVADFGNVNFFDDFDVIMQTDTLAQIGQQVCFTLTVNPIAGDNNPANNVLTICFPVVNSYDPNDKQAYPAGNIDTLQEELTYTVRFQNTGNAEAQHIYITDTLDANVRPETFELLAYSHQPMVQIDGNAVKFNFPNINLPDSFTNEPGSHGYVQYKVKLKDNLPIGTTINNTAFIYFDFNPPVITNTTTNTVAIKVDTTVGMRHLKTDAQVFVYPNPASNVVTVTVSKNMHNATVTITDILGRKAMEPVTLNNTQTTTLNTQQLPDGIYMVNVKAANGAGVTKRLVVRK